MLGKSTGSQADDETALSVQPASATPTQTITDISTIIDNNIATAFAATTTPYRVGIPKSLLHPPRPYIVDLHYPGIICSSQVVALGVYR